MTAPTTFAIEKLTWPQVQTLQQQNPLLVLPIGATEQHGPALPIGTDSIIAQSLCQAACPQAQVAYAPTLCYTSSAAHSSKWPGTFSLTPLTLIDTLTQLAQWAQATGWKKLYLVNAHAGNDAPLRVAVDQIRLQLLGALQIGYCSTFTLTPAIQALFTEDAQDLHANQGEADLMLYLAPETVDTQALASADDPDRTADCVFSYPVSQTSLNGTTGKPSHGNAHRGQQLFSLMTEALVHTLQQAKSEDPPLDPSHWAGIPDNFY